MRISTFDISFISFVESKASRQLIMAPKTSGKAAKKAGKAQKNIIRTLRNTARRGRNLMPSTSSRCWSKSTQTLESRAKPWASWTPSSMTSSNVLPRKPPAWLTTTNVQPSRVAKSKQPFVSCCLVNWPSTQSVKEPKPSPNTLHQSKSTVESTSKFNPFFSERPISLKINGCLKLGQLNS